MLIIMTFTLNLLLYNNSVHSTQELIMNLNPWYQICSLLCCSFALLSFSDGTLAEEVRNAENPNLLTKQEQAAGFKLLFNGTDLTGWKQDGNWEVTDGAIARSKKGGSLVYNKTKVPDDFELRFQWKVAKGSNSGIYYRPGQYEYQILDNKRHRNGSNPRTTAASLYFCMAPSRDATTKVGEWNTGRIVCKGSVIQHWLNGQKVIDFDYANSKWKENVALLRRRGGDLKARGAFLSLQDHGDPVWYRGIKWRTIPQNETLKRSEVIPASIPDIERKKELEKVRRIEANRKKK